MTLLEEKEFRLEAGKIALDLAFARLGLIKDEISQREAFRLFGQTTVRSWVNEGLVKRIKIGDKNTKVTYSRIELETLGRLQSTRKISR